MLHLFLVPLKLCEVSLVSKKDKSLLLLPPCHIITYSKKVNWTDICDFYKDTTVSTNKSEKVAQINGQCLTVCLMDNV